MTVMTDVRVGGQACSVGANRCSGVFNIGRLFVALIYACFFYALPVDAFVDRDNYLVYAGDAGSIFSYYLEQGFFKLFFNEPVWLLYNMLLGSFYSPEMVVRITIFFSAFVVAFYVFENRPLLFIPLLLFLFFPQVVVKYVVHLRQGFAIALFLIGYFSAGRFHKVFFISLSAFVHLSFVFVLALFFLIWVVKFLRLDEHLAFIGVLIFGFFVSIGLPFLSSVFGARQFDRYEFKMPDVSGFGFFFWCTTALLFLFEGRKFLSQNLLSFLAVGFYLSTYFFIEVTGRIFESLVLLVLLSTLRLTGWRFSVFFMMFGVTFIMMYYVKVGLPWFGWAAVED